MGRFSSDQKARATPKVYHGAGVWQGARQGGIAALARCRFARYDKRPVLGRPEVARTCCAAPCEEHTVGRSVP